MAFKMSFKQSDLEGIKPVPAGLYTVRFKSFKPGLSNKGTSTNLNPQVEIINNSEFEGRPVFTSLNLQIQSFIQDFVHSFGLEMEDQTGAEPGIPGIFDADAGKYKADDPSTYVYQGPLTGKTAKWELGVGEYNGKPSQTVRKFVCSVPKCTERFPNVKHADDMAKKG